MSDPALAAARLRASTARERLLDTGQELQQRLRPASLAANAREAVVRKGGAIAGNAAAAVAQRPRTVSATVAGIGALLALGLIARRRHKLREMS